MTALAAPYTLLRRDGEARISRPEPSHRTMGRHVSTPVDVLPERRAGLLRPEAARLIAERNFTVAFQPVVRLADSRPVSHEALLRLRPLPGGASQPARPFVDAVQGWGLGMALDEAVLDVALASWPRAADTPMSVNIGARSLGDPVFFARALVRLGGEGATVALEIAGPRDATDLPAMVAMVPALRAVGVRVVLDDFGPDEVSLACIRQTRFDEVKLSGAVVGEAVASERGRRLLRALVRLADATGARTVAKLIETVPQARLMRELGVGHGQGWLFGAPVPMATDRRRRAA